MDPGELWKERLAFASGNILAWSIVLITFWPAASRIQTGMHIHFWTLNLPQQGVRSSLWIYWAVTALLSLAISTMFLAIAHILMRGLWLGLYIEKQSTLPSLVSRSDAPTDRIDRLSLTTYQCIFLLIGLTGFWITLTIPVLISAGFESLLVSYLSFSLTSAGWLTRILLVVLVLAIQIPIVRRLFNSKRFKGFINESGCFELITYTLCVVAFFVVWFAAMECCYSLELKVDKNVFHQATNDVVEINASLGGATSAIIDASLRVVDADGNGVERDLVLNDIGHGQYIAYLASSSLAPGRYRIILEYPHVSFDLAFPFLHRKILHSALILVVT